MSLKDLVEGAKKAAPGLQGIPDAKAVALLREAFHQIGQQIDVANEGVVKVPGLGNFRVKMVEREKDGQKATVKRVIFNPAVAKPGEEKGAKKAGQAKAG